jgi:hypothetical protein
MSGQMRKFKKIHNCINFTLKTSGATFKKHDSHFLLSTFEKGVLSQNQWFGVNLIWQ